MEETPYDMISQPLPKYQSHVSNIDSSFDHQPKHLNDTRDDFNDTLDQGV